MPEGYWWYMNDARHYDKSTEVIHSEGHKPPRYLTLGQLETILTFLETQLLKVNKSSEVVCREVAKVRAALPGSVYIRAKL